MANPNHLAKLAEGAESWNEWRAENRYAPVDLSGAHSETERLLDVDLAGANLSNANLRAADLTGATLLKARLEHADVKDTVLTKANLNMTNLFRVQNLREARLAGANMFMANLTRVDRGGTLRTYRSAIRDARRMSSLWRLVVGYRSKRS
jgi:uncharacterized protein YjbI with pentapeptide repeats